MARKLSREQFLKAATAPKRRFKMMTVAASGAVRLRNTVEAPCYWFERHDERVKSDGTYTTGGSEATVTMMVDGIPSALFYLAGSRMESCTFAFHLTEHQLGRAVAALKRAKLTKFISSAAESASKNLPASRRATLAAVLRQVAQSSRHGSGAGPR